MAREYALKTDVERDLKQIMDRFDRLEIKLDNLMERIIK
jgi:P2-related tail formation protein